METILKNSILDELREVTEKGISCKHELWNLSVKLKLKISGFVNNDSEMLDNYRFCIHLQNELIYKKKKNLKKKRRFVFKSRRIGKYL